MKRSMLALTIAFFASCSPDEDAGGVVALPDPAAPGVVLPQTSVVSDPISMLILAGLR